MLMCCRNRRFSHILHVILIVINVLTVHDLIVPVTGNPAVETPNKSIRDDVTADGVSRSDQRSILSNVEPELPRAAGSGHANRPKSSRNDMAGENRYNSPMNTADRNIHSKSFIPGNRYPTFSQHSSGTWSSVKSPLDDTMAKSGRYRRSRWSRYRLLRSNKRSSDESALQADEPDFERIEPMAYNLRNFEADELMKGGKYSDDIYGKSIPEWRQADRNELEETELARLQSDEPQSADSNDVMMSEEPEVSTDKRAYPPHTGDSLLKRLAAAGRPDLGSWNGNQRGWVSNNVRIWG